MDTVRVALVGCGTIANVMHLPGIAQMEEMGKVDLLAVCDMVEEKARAAADKFAVPRSFGDLDRMLGELDFDVLVNNTPIPQHYAVTKAALRAGRHVYTQKPMTQTVAEATDLIEEAHARKLLLACAPEHPVRPFVKKIRQLVDEGAIGKVTFAQVQSSHDGPEKHDVPRDSTWYYKPGSNPILDLGVHGLSVITAILGPVRRVACMSGRSLPERITTKGPFTGKKIEVEIDDNSLLTLDFGDARLAYLDATYCLEASLVPRLEIHGSEGTIAMVGKAPFGQMKLFRSAEGEWQDVEVPEAPPVRDLGTLHLVDCLREGTPLELTPERGRHLVEVLAAAPRAAAEERTLHVETSF